MLFLIHSFFANRSIFTKGLVNVLYFTLLYISILLSMHHFSAKMAMYMYMDLQNDS